MCVILYEIDPETLELADAQLVFPFRGELKLPDVIQKAH